MNKRSIDHEQNHEYACETASRHMSTCEKHQAQQGNELPTLLF
jgi:hypothetical protein